jgi:hypothetical protein
VIFWAMPTEVSFDQPPAHREIGIVFGQCPNTMEMIGQKDNDFL